MKRALTISVLVNIILVIYLYALRQCHLDSESVAPEAAQTEATAEGDSVGSQTNETEDDFVESANRDGTDGLPFRTRLSERPPAMPLVFQEIDLSELNLNNDQLQAIADLRERFLDEIGGLEQDPHDQAYWERWQKSQPGIDDDLRGMIGVAAFQNYQVAAATADEKLP